MRFGFSKPLDLDVLAHVWRSALLRLRRRLIARLQPAMNRFLHRPADRQNEYEQHERNEYRPEHSCSTRRTKQRRDPYRGSRSQSVDAPFIDAMQDHPGAEKAYAGDQALDDATLRVCRVRALRARQLP